MVGTNMLYSRVIVRKYWVWCVSIVRVVYWLVDHWRRLVEYQWCLVINYWGSVQDHRTLVINNRWVMYQNVWTMDHHPGTVVDFWRGVVNYRGSMHNDGILSICFLGIMALLSGFIPFLRTLVLFP